MSIPHFLFIIFHLSFIFLYLRKQNDKDKNIMEHETFFEVVGWIASISLILGYLPQALQTIRTRRTDDIAVPTFLMMAIGGICFMIQGYMLGREGIFLFVTNLITTICSVIIFGIKIYNDYIRKK